MPISDAVREVFKQGRDDNPASWRWMIAFYEYVATLPAPQGERCLPLARLVHQIADSPDAMEFRAGQSLHDLLISTKPENGLSLNDHSIRVSAGYGTPGMLYVEYWRGVEAGDLMESHTVSESQLLDTIKPLLARLRSVAQAGQI